MRKNIILKTKVEDYYIYTVCILKESSEKKGIYVTEIFFYNDVFFGICPFHHYLKVFDLKKEAEKNHQEAIDYVKRYLNIR